VGLFSLTKGLTGILIEAVAVGVGLVVLCGVLATPSTSGEETSSSSRQTEVDWWNNLWGGSDTDQQPAATTATQTTDVTANLVNPVANHQPSPFSQDNMAVPFSSPTVEPALQPGILDLPPLKSITALQPTKPLEVEAQDAPGQHLVPQMAPRFGRWPGAQAIALTQLPPQANAEQPAQAFAPLPPAAPLSNSKPVPADLAPELQPRTAGQFVDDFGNWLQKTNKQVAAVAASTGGKLIDFGEDLGKGAKQVAGQAKDTSQNLVGYGQEVGRGINQNFASATAPTLGSPATGSAPNSSLASPVPSASSSTLPAPLETIGGITINRPVYYYGSFPQPGTRPTGILPAGTQAKRLGAVGGYDVLETAGGYRVYVMP
jgi:hypothetical protein